VIGSAVGGIQYSVVDGLTGYLVPPNDPQALADHLRYLQEHPALARALGLAGVRRARAMFTWDEVAAQLSATYQRFAPTVQPVRARKRPRLQLVKADAANAGAGSARSGAAAAAVTLIAAK
jgi:hypothetical protein